MYKLEITKTDYEKILEVFYSAYDVRVMIELLYHSAESREIGPALIDAMISIVPALSIFHNNSQEIVVPISRGLHVDEKDVQCAYGFLGKSFIRFMGIDAELVMRPKEERFEKDPVIIDPQKFLLKVFRI